MDVPVTPEQLKRFAGMFEVYQKTSFQCYRNKKDGGTQEVLVEILDAGPGVDYGRYHVVATSDDGKTATGNPAASIETVLATVHWFDLD